MFALKHGTPEALTRRSIIHKEMRQDLSAPQSQRLLAIATATSLAGTEVASDCFKPKPETLGKNLAILALRISPLVAATGIATEIAQRKFRSRYQAVSNTNLLDATVVF